MKNASYFLRKKGSKCTDKDREEMLLIIDNDINRSDKIISDLIEYASDVCLEIESCTAKSLLASALSTLEVPKKISVIDQTLETPKFLADASKIQKVFTLIIKNALEAMPNGGTLEVSSVQTDSNVQITFADTGVGIPEDILPKLFSPLLTTKAQGMGLSLAICKRIVDCHGGKIEAESLMGKGATIKLNLPIKPDLPKIDQEAQVTKQDPLLHYNSLNAVSDIKQAQV